MMNCICIYNTVATVACNIIYGPSIVQVTPKIWVGNGRKIGHFVSQYNNIMR